MSQASKMTFWISTVAAKVDIRDLSPGHTMVGQNWLLIVQGVVKSHTHMQTHTQAERIN